MSSGDYITDAKIKKSEIALLRNKIEAVQDWIADYSQKDNGRVFWDTTPNNQLTLITYGDLRKLMNIVGDV